MLAEERYQIIMDLIEQEGSVKVSNLIKLFNVSIETIRRDMEYLESEGLLKRVYGGAIPVQSIIMCKQGKSYTSFMARVSKNIDEKLQIASTAIKLISEGDSIALDSGTTTLELAKALKKNFNRLTILTNSLMVLNELSEVSNFTVISTGGIFKGDEYSFVGDMACDVISGFNIDKAFISVSGVSLKNGLTDWRMEEIQIQKKMIDMSNEVIVLTDSAKFNNSSLLNICSIENVSAIVTDTNLDKDTLLDYSGAGVKIFY